MNKKTNDLYDLFNIVVCTSGTIYSGYEAMSSSLKPITIISTLGVAYGFTWLFNRFSKGKPNDDPFVEDNPEILDDFIIQENRSSLS